LSCTGFSPASRLKTLTSNASTARFAASCSALAPNGRLVDNSGFAVAGIVHEDEYVVPKWMRADPQVAAVEQRLEARRLRGYFEGGATGGAALPAAASAVLPVDGKSLMAYPAELLAALRLMTQQLADVKY
jgi:hypothetical protein